uniref:Myosin-VIIa n=1 Tax=Lygus hesperus TaxID=30085 RepID=A0A0A9Y592_LYGHE
MWTRCDNGWLSVSQPNVFVLQNGITSFHEEIEVMQVSKLHQHQHTTGHFSKLLYHLRAIFTVCHLTQCIGRDNKVMLNGFILRQQITLSADLRHLVMEYHRANLHHSRTRFNRRDLLQRL